MAYTQAIDETTPAGTDDAKTADDQLRALKRDIKERLNSFFADYNSDPLTPKANALFSNNINIPNSDWGIIINTVGYLIRFEPTGDNINVGWDVNKTIRIATFLTAAFPAPNVATKQGCLAIDRQLNRLVYYSGNDKYYLVGTAF